MVCPPMVCPPVGRRSVQTEAPQRKVFFSSLLAQRDRRETRFGFRSPMPLAPPRGQSFTSEGAVAKESDASVGPGEVRV